MSQNLSRDETETKFIGTAVPINFYRKLRAKAVREDLSLSGFLREALIERLEKNQTKKKNS